MPNVTPSAGARYAHSRLRTTDAPTNPPQHRPQHLERLRLDRARSDPHPHPSDNSTDDIDITPVTVKIIPNDRGNQSARKAGWGEMAAPSSNLAAIADLLARAASEPGVIPTWDAGRALAALAVTEIPFDALDGNCLGYARQRSIATPQDVS
jgi:hypothetical protein